MQDTGGGAPRFAQERSVQSEFHLHRNQCDGAVHPKWMLGEADGMRNLNQKMSVLSIFIKAGMNSWGGEKKKVRVIYKRYRDRWRNKSTKDHKKRHFFYFWGGECKDRRRDSLSLNCVDYSDTSRLPQQQ